MQCILGEAPVAEASEREAAEPGTVHEPRAADALLGPDIAGKVVGDVSTEGKRRVLMRSPSSLGRATLRHVADGPFRAADVVAVLDVSVPRSCVRRRRQTRRRRTYTEPQ